jgi:hypothetical protein
MNVFEINLPVLGEIGGTVNLRQRESLRCLCAICEEELL